MRFGRASASTWRREAALRGATVAISMRGRGSFVDDREEEEGGKEKKRTSTAITKLFLSSFDFVEPEKRS